MAGRPKTRAKIQEAADKAGVSFEEMKQQMEIQKQEERDRKLDEKAKKLEARRLQEHVRLKRSELSEWMVNFVSGNMRKHGQAILDALLEEDPKEASRFLTQMMRFAAPTVADPTKDDNKKATDTAQPAPEYEEAAKRINTLKRKFNKDKEE